MVDVRDVANVCVGALDVQSKTARYHAWGELVSMDQVIDLVKTITDRNYVGNGNKEKDKRELDRIWCATLNEWKGNI